MASLPSVPLTLEQKFLQDTHFSGEITSAAGVAAELYNIERKHLGTSRQEWEDHDLKQALNVTPGLMIPVMALKELHMLAAYTQAKIKYAGLEKSENDKDKKIVQAIKQAEQNFRAGREALGIAISSNIDRYIAGTAVQNELAKALSPNPADKEKEKKVSELKEKLLKASYKQFEAERDKRVTEKEAPRAPFKEEGIVTPGRLPLLNTNQNRKI